MQRRLTVEHGRLVLRADYDPLLVRALQNVPLHRLRPDGAWEFAFPVRAHVLKICDEHAVEVDETIRQPPATLTERVEHVAASRALDATFEVPGLALELRPFQRAGVAYATDRRRCIIGDDMGLGKGGQALATLQVCQAFPAAVIVPSSIKINWARECVKWLPHIRVGVLYGIPSNRLAADVAARLRLMGRPSRHRIVAGMPVKIELDHPGQVDRVARMLNELDVVILNYDIIGPTELTKTERKRGVVLDHAWTPVLLAMGLRGVVADESHMIMHDESLRSRAARQISWSLDAEDDVVLALSGSAVLNRRIELAAQLDFIGRLHEFGGYKGIVDLPDLAVRVRARCMIRRLKRHVAPELPPRVHAPVVFDRESLDPTIMREYDAAEADTLEYLADLAAQHAAELGENPESAAVETRMRLANNETLVRINVLRKLAMQAKLPAAERWITNFRRSGEKLLVFGNHLEGLDRFAARFQAPLIKGGVKTEQRMRIVDSFQTDPATWIVFLQIIAGGVGLTMTAASNILFIEHAWSPLIMDQAIDRGYGRLNDMHGATGWYLIAEGTIDEWVMDLHAAKRIECEDALDGDLSDDVERTSVYAELVVRMTRRALARRRVA